MPYLIFVLVVAILLVAVFLGGVYALTKRPLVITVEMPPVVIDLSGLIPTPLVVQQQMIPADRLPPGMAEEPMPSEVYGYIAQESEEHARASRGRYARKLRLELGSWSAALSQLKLEDGIIE